MKKKTIMSLLLILIIAVCTGQAFAADLPITESIDPGFGFAPVTAIVVICYLVAAVLKATTINNKWLPVICGTIGGVLGLVAMSIMPEYPAHDYLTAIAIGITSGFAATGVNQVHKQLSNTKK